MASIDDLVGLIGREEAQRLVQAFGGTRLYIPRARHPSLEPILGARAHARLVARYGGERIDVPSPNALERADAIADARRHLAEGAGIRDVARRTGLSRRHVARLRRS